MGNEFFSTIKWLADHRIAQQDMAYAIRRYFQWQLATRIFNEHVVVPFVGETSLILQRGMRGATGNVYAGLQDCEEMAFVLHALRDRDHFVDVGANIGSYSVLASGVAGARSTAFEPVPATFEMLVKNVRYNGLTDLVDCERQVVGEEDDTLWMTTDQGAANRVVRSDGENRSGSAVEVPSNRLDELQLAGEALVVKIDAEGWEGAVVAGAERTLSRGEPVALIVEFIGLASRYGYGENKIKAKLDQLGFRPVRYNPFDRSLVRARWSEEKKNLIAVNNEEFFKRRTIKAEPFIVRGLQI